MFDGYPLPPLLWLTWAWRVQQKSIACVIFPSSPALLLLHADCFRSFRNTIASHACGWLRSKANFFNLFDKSKAKLEKVRKVQASPPLGRKNTRAGPFCTWQPTLGTGLLLGLAFLKGYLYLGFQPARAYCMHKDGSSIFRKKKGRPDLLFLGLADMAN